MEHIVKQGECLSSLAARYGLNGWKELYDDPKNAELKRKRSNPNILLPGDRVVVPDPAPEKVVTVATGRDYPFLLKVVKVKLRIAIVSQSGKPYVRARFIVNAKGLEFRGTTNADGMVEVEVPAMLPTARLRVWLAEQGEDAPQIIDRDLTIGHIDPIETKSGVRGRLSNLGGACPITVDPDTGVDGRLFAAARSFRAKYGLPEIEWAAEDGKPSEGDETYAERLLDDAFRAKLLDVYERSSTA